MRTIILIREIHTTEEYNVMPASKTFLNVKKPKYYRSFMPYYDPL